MWFVDFEVCNPNPCQNGGTCKALSSTRFSCACNKHCNGSNCENCALGKDIEREHNLNPR